MTATTNRLSASARPARTAYDVPVPKVDTVKVADDDDRTTQIGRHIGEGTPDSHDVNLLACEWGTP